MARARQEIGVRLMGRGHQVFARVHGIFRSTFMPHPSTAGERAAAREQLIAQYGGTRAAEAGSLAALVATYLAKPDIAAKASADEIAAHLAKWLAELGADRTPLSVTRDDVEAVLQRWLADFSPVTVYHRRTSLGSCYRTMYGPEGYNPVRGTTRPDHYRPTNKSLPWATIQRILDRMPAWRYVKRGIRQPSLAKLRATVIAATGLPPAELAKLNRHHFDRAASCLRMPWRDKGAGTPAYTRELKTHGLAAIAALDAANGWGAFPAEALARSFKRAARAELGPETPVSLYWLRHSVGADTYRVTRDLETVRRVLGHAEGSICTSRYAMGAHAEVDRAALEALAAYRTAQLQGPAAPESDLKLRPKLRGRRKRQRNKMLSRVS